VGLNLSHFQPLEGTLFPEVVKVHEDVDDDDDGDEDDKDDGDGVRRRRRDDDGGVCCGFDPYSRVKNCPTVIRQLYPPPSGLVSHLLPNPTALAAVRSNASRSFRWTIWIPFRGRRGDD